MEASLFFQYTVAVGIALGVIALIVIVVGSVLLRSKSRREMHAEMAARSKGKVVDVREMIFQQKLENSHKRDEWEMDRLGQVAYDKHLQDDGLLDPGQPTLSSTLRRPRKGV